MNDGSKVIINASTKACKRPPTRRTRFKTAAYRHAQHVVTSPHDFFSSAICHALQLLSRPAPITFGCEGECAYSIIKSWSRPKRLGWIDTRRVLSSAHVWLDRMYPTARKGPQWLVHLAEALRAPPSSRQLAAGCCASRSTPLGLGDSLPPR